ncbi:major facilitator superfamily domain-containing protein 9-like [Homalodisca vitripennis]|uniref:major facilitator superfamily domain-containing protein 9-like n=1 Tax=Homalodisca vitripennis TaxID=197043 RepID=UPI001EEB8624|nr:major facilitator superfamily domain-containing protein 9-like [Homalodisca vitripennis]XP_046676167.1 major facilitator superfamily domain-containing protein 9-like [Homalodisca vitripennis]XP_046676168.1 major facilitator superfamily domain-containing protein 9-like [Homalodisca vitripennis]XP_046676169.1 major facilitator superfamily domain-containing protein 9-like [Homalodisca vitripennis]KAG8312167.1 transporter activity protein [Homalodisca vitripennis]
MLQEIRQPWSWVYIVSFLDFFGVSMILPVMSTHLRGLGISYVDIGLLSSVSGMTQLIFGPIIGSWSDIQGRHTVLFLTLIVCSSVYGLMGIVSSFYLFLILNSVLGAAQHTMMLCQAYIADIVPVNKQPAVNGLTNAFMAFSFMIGPIIGGHVMEIDGGFQYLTAIVSLMLIFNSAIVFVFGNVHKTAKKEKTKNVSALNQVIAIFKDLLVIDWKKYWVFLSLKFLFAMSGMLFFQNMGIILTDSFDLTPRYMGYTISFYGLISFISNLNVGRIKSLNIFPKNNYESLMYMFCVMAVTFYWLYIVENCWLFLAGLVPLAASNALAEIVMTEVLVEQTDASSRGSMMGVSASVAAIVQIFAPFLSGLIASWGGISSALRVSSLISATACFITLRKSRKVHVKSQ